MALAPGMRLGPYEITAHIGAGGMGEVYRARDAGLARDVAIKVLLEPFAHDPERLARFEREARTLAALSHPNIAHIHGLEKNDGTTALVMELVEGPTLADRLEAGPIPLHDALLIARQIAEGLEAAHDQGIIHRDLKPANIKVRPDDTVKILDFGLAKALEPARATSPGVTASPTIDSPTLMTGVGVLLGTAAYMSPEQARGKPADKRADIWAFGCVLFEMLSGTRPFDDEDVSMTLSKVLQREPDFELLPSDVPARVRQTIRLCLRKPLKERMPDMAAVRLTLDGAFDTAAPQTTDQAAVARPLRRAALPVAAAAVAALLLTGLAAWGLWPTMEPQAVSRFSYELPPDHIFTSAGRPVMALSRDGRRFVYNTTAGLYLRSLDALEARLLPGTQSGVTNPFFAPDGDWIGYFDDGQLRRINVSGGSAVPICAATNPFGVSWATDNTIFFGQPSGIMRVSANGGTPALVVPAKKGEYVYGPQLLPDGDSVLFSVTTASGPTRWDAAQIVVQSLSTGERTLILRGGSDARYVSTGHLVYAVGGTLLAVAFDVGRLQISGGPVPVVEGIARAAIPTVNTASANFGVSDDGTLAYVGVGTGRGFSTTVGLPTRMATLAWVDRQGREEPLAAPPRPYVYARLSPDGTRVALLVRDEEEDIWTWDIRRQILTRVTFDPSLDTSPVWTPDGQRIAWASQRSGALNIYWQAADNTGAIERLTESRSAQLPSGFTPDGRGLLFSEFTATAYRVMMVSLGGDRRVTPVINTMYAEGNGEVSPDGRWLAYHSNESGQVQVYVRPFPEVGTGKWQVSNNGGRQPIWAPSGRELFYVAPDGAVIGVQMDAGHAIGAPATLIAGPRYYSGLEGPLSRSYDVSPDGKRFLRIKFVEGEASGNNAPRRVVMVQNWTDELKRRVPAN